MIVYLNFSGFMHTVPVLQVGMMFCHRKNQWTCKQFSKIYGLVQNVPRANSLEVVRSLE